MLAYQFRDAGGALASAERINSGVQKPLPHNPTTPEIARLNPIKVFLRQRRSRNRSPAEPILFCAPACAEARALCQASGSFMVRNTKTTSRAGTMPTKNIQRHPRGRTTRL